MDRREAMGIANAAMHRWRDELCGARRAESYSDRLANEEVALIDEALALLSTPKPRPEGTCKECGSRLPKICAGCGEPIRGGVSRVIGPGKSSHCNDDCEARARKTKERDQARSTSLDLGKGVKE